MNKLSADTKVKKTLLRNYEQKAPSSQNRVVYDVDACSSRLPERSLLRSSQKENILSEPSLCSSEAIATYLSETKKSLPLLSEEDSNIDKNKFSNNMTKRLNFHFNDRIYKNLIELNASIDKNKTKSRRPSSNVCMKRDLEPNIEDFYVEEKDTELPPVIPIIKPKFKPIKKLEDGRLHRLISSFEDL